MYGSVPASTLTGVPELAGTAEAPLPPTGEAPGRASPKSSSFAPDPREHHVGRLEVAVHDARLACAATSASAMSMATPRAWLDRQRPAPRGAPPASRRRPVPSPGTLRRLRRSWPTRRRAACRCADGLSRAIARASRSRRWRRVVSDARREHLDGDVAIQARVARPVDLAHPTRSDQADHVEGAEPIARAQVTPRRPPSRLALAVCSGSPPPPGEPGAATWTSWTTRASSVCACTNARRASGGSVEGGVNRSAGRCCQSPERHEAPPELAVQPGPRHRPVPLHRDRRHIQHDGGFVDRQPAEEPELHEPRLPCVEPGELLQRVVERDDVRVPRQAPPGRCRPATRSDPLPASRPRGPARDRPAGGASRGTRLRRSAPGSATGPDADRRASRRPREPARSRPANGHGARAGGSRGPAGAARRRRRPSAARRPPPRRRSRRSADGSRRCPVA